MKRLIKDKGTTKRVVDLKFVAKALGAEDAGIEIDTKRGPISLFTLREFLVSRLYSTGGRPRLKGTSKRRPKVACNENDWKKLDEISKYLRVQGIKVSPSQIASGLIHIGIEQVTIKKKGLY